VSRDTCSSQPFECMFLEARSLSRVSPDPHTFESYFSKDEEDVVVFKNLGRDAILVSPKPHGSLDYSHFSAFHSHAPAAQKDLLWRRVGDVMLQSCNDTHHPIWLSTSGELSHTHTHIHTHTHF
jgi:hypothetical protein